MKLSVAVCAYNEERNIGRCLESVRWADEIVVVDEKSQDRTVAIAKKYTARIFLVDHGSNGGKTHDTMFHKHKQLAIEKCTGEWVLQIDADEEVTPELREEIKKVIEETSSPFSAVAYRVPRRSLIFGHWMEHTGWYPDYQLKLFRRGKGKYPCRTVHEEVTVRGEIGVLQSDLRHYHYTTVEEFVDRMNRYTTNDAKYLMSKGERASWEDALRFPADEFIKRFFYFEGYKDGLHGLVVSLLQAASRLVVFAKLWEAQGFFTCREKDFYEKVLQQGRSIASDWRYWEAEKTDSPVKKFLLKTRNKIQNTLIKWA